MKWLKSLENIAQNKLPGPCPICGSTDTDFSMVRISAGSNRGYGDIWCNECKHAYHISRMKIEKERNRKADMSKMIY